METTYINYLDMPYALQDFAESISSEEPKILEHIDGWYEDTYKGIVYLCFTEDLYGGTYCYEPASGYKDHCDTFFDWLDKHGRVVEIELDFLNSKKAGYPDKDTLTVFKRHLNLSRDIDPEVGYLGTLVWDGYTVIAVNGKKDGFKVDGKILTMLE